MKLLDLHAYIKTHCSPAETRILLEDIIGNTPAELITSGDKQIPQPIIDKIKAILSEKATGKPLSKILGYKEFYGLNFIVSEHTLDPRPETEILVMRALEIIEDIQSPSVLDLGTGTGCIPISILSHHQNATAIAADISDAALQVAATNTENHGLNHRLILKNSDWFKNINGKFDLITANPPYIDSEEIPNLSPEVKNHDPILALDGGKNGLDPYKIIFSSIKNFLKPQGRALFEIGYDQCGHILRLAENYRIRIDAIHPDLAGIPRVVEIYCGDK
jgi:release factor glutamine methyltransferase